MWLIFHFVAFVMSASALAQEPAPPAVCDQEAFSNLMSQVGAHCATDECSPSCLTDIDAVLTNDAMLVCFACLGEQGAQVLLNLQQTQSTCAASEGCDADAATIVSAALDTDCGGGWSKRCSSACQARLDAVLRNQAILACFVDENGYNSLQAEAELTEADCSAASKIRPTAFFTAGAALIALAL
jgi:hypothetical protein